jgi:hypothetical protein
MAQSEQHRLGKGHRLHLSYLCSEYITDGVLELVGTSHALSSLLNTHSSCDKGNSSDLSRLQRTDQGSYLGREELDTLMRAIVGGSVQPFIHSSLTSGKVKKPGWLPRYRAYRRLFHPSYS